MMNPHTAAITATGTATLMVKVMSGWLCFIAPRMSRKNERNATEIKKQITPVTEPMAKLRSNLRINLLGLLRQPESNSTVGQPAILPQRHKA